MPQAGSQLLEFRLGSDSYCVDIDCIDEIVNRSEIRSLPNTPPHVTGITDLRGTMTTVIDPAALLGLEKSVDQRRIIVLDGSTQADESSSVGWLVDDVTQVFEVADGDIEQAALGADDTVTELISRDDEFVIKLSPAAMAV